MQGIWMAAATAGATGGGPSELVAIIVAAIGGLGVIATAFGPALTERAKLMRSGSAPAAPPAETPATVGAASTPALAVTPTLATPDRDADVFDALEESIRDLRAQRDVAQADLARLHRETGEKIEHLREELTEARIAIAQLRAGRYTS